MMELRYQEDILASERQIARETFSNYRRDRTDLYVMDCCRRDHMTRDLILSYRIVQVKCNPDFDW